MKTKTAGLLGVWFILMPMFFISAQAQNLLNQPESVVYDTTKNRYLVSNKGNGKIIQVFKTANMSIQSVFNQDQSSSMGLCIAGNRLYAVCDEGVAGFDLGTGSRVMMISIPEKQFINDIAPDTSGFLYVTDMNAGKIYKVNPDNQTYSTFASGLTSPNGIYHDIAQNRLLLVNWGTNARIRAVSLSDGSVSTLVITGAENLDGITADVQGRIYVSSWGTNSVLRYSDSFATAEQFSAGHDGPADIYFDHENNVLAVPNMNANTLDYIDIPPPANEEGWNVVTNTSDSGPGSLRAAITEANRHAGPDSIVFNIPQSDSNFNGSAGVWTIRPESSLPALEDGGTVVDGTTQTENQGNMNVSGFELELDGSIAGRDGLTITSGSNEIRGMVINNFSGSGILIRGRNAVRNTVRQNLIGTDANGTSAVANRYGISIQDGAQYNSIGQKGQPNIISGNIEYGIYIWGEGTDYNCVLGNFIGIDRTASNLLGNSSQGITIAFGAKYNCIGRKNAGEANLISGSSTSNTVLTGNGILLWESESDTVSGNLISENIKSGICVYGGGQHVIGDSGDYAFNTFVNNGSDGILLRMTNYNRIRGNYIGTDFISGTEAGNGRNGIRLDFGSKNNIIGPGNHIAFNGQDGVQVDHDSTVNNKITQNLISGNSGKGISTINGGNRALTPPVITFATSDTVHGLAPVGMKVEIFTDEEDEGGTYETTVTAKGAGIFISTKSMVGRNVTATVTDAEGNTSEFSHPTATQVEHEMENHMPQSNSLSQNFPNPFNEVTTLRFNVAKGTNVKIVIYDLRGREVAKPVHRYYEAGAHEVRFNCGKLVSGIYFYTGEMDGSSHTQKMVLMR